MDEKVHGGKRLGAGRKPVLNKKKQVTLYVETKLILPFGGEEKMKEKLYEFISGYGQNTAQPPKSNENDFKAPKSEAAKNEEQPLSFDQMKAEIAPQRPPKTFTQYQSEKREFDTEEQYEKWLAEVEADPFLSRNQKNLLKSIL